MPTVLVADDSRTIRTVVGMVLKGTDYTISEAASAQEVIEKVRAEPSVVLLDYHMPDASGYELCRTLKTNHNTSHIPVVMMGGSYQSFDESKALQSGADGVVRKPFTVDTLLSVLAAAASATVPVPVEDPPTSEFAGAPLEGIAIEPPSQPQPPAQPQPLAEQPVSRSAGWPSQQASLKSDVQEQAPAASMASEDHSMIREDMPTNPQQVAVSHAGVTAGEIRTEEPRPRVDSVSQPGYNVTPDINATSRRPSSTSTSTAAAPGGLYRAEIEKMIRDEVKNTVRTELPGLLRSIMGEVFQKKVLPKLTKHAEDRVQYVLTNELGTRIREQVRQELERLLSE